jgi:hypothetical protein
MNYYSELKVDDPKEREKYQRLGLAYFERAAQSPEAPPIVLDLIRGIARKMSRDDILLYALSDELARAEDPERREQIAQRIMQLRERLALKSGDQSGSAETTWLKDRQAHLKSVQMYEAQRDEVRMYLSPLEYEMIFTKSSLPLDWQTLSGINTTSSNPSLYKAKPSMTSAKSSAESETL